jgi:hypothetical protein
VRIVVLSVIVPKECKVKARGCRAMPEPYPKPYLDDPSRLTRGTSRRIFCSEPRCQPSSQSFRSRSFPVHPSDFRCDSGFSPMGRQPFPIAERISDNDDPNNNKFSLNIGLGVRLQQLRHCLSKQRRSKIHLLPFHVLQVLQKA